MKRLLIHSAVITAIFCSGEGRADVYRYDGDDEVISFSDSPLDKRYQLVMKEPQSRSAKTARGKYLPDAKKTAAPASRQDGQNGITAHNLPVAGGITSLTGFRNDPFDGKLRHHNGLDIAAPSGTPVKSVAPGTVIFSGWKGGYGNTVILDHHDGMVTVYAHHASNSVAEGAIVDRDTVIAFTGSTGRSTGPHLHFEAWRGDMNITADFIPGSYSEHRTTSLAQVPIHRVLQQDGSILFTNLR